MRKFTDLWQRRPLPYFLHTDQPFREAICQSLSGGPLHLYRGMYHNVP